MTRAVDNDFYNRIAAQWWDESAPIHFLRASLNPGRFDYFRRVLVDRAGLVPKDLRVLDVGCGGGYLAEEFARLGCAVTGVDPSAATLATAGDHARAEGLAIEYREGRGEALPAGDGAFDVVYCCDVLEHVDDPARVIAEIARVLRAGGLFLYDTINRTRASRLVMIKLVQDWPTRLLPRDVHVWEKFLTPGEVEGWLRAAKLEAREVRGLSPHAHPLRMAADLARHKLGRLGVSDFGRRLAFSESDDLSISYMGWARRATA
ncbi:MAG: 3-demethylubiquinone-9 3-O-methyltransferase [Myxococcales bacterium]|nr:3-demethylubiquinone-9 3-O-methyltransferase [Myxococcales bacterium]